MVTQLLLARDVEVNPGPGGSSFLCGLCEIDANWSNGGIACEHCDDWDCARLNLSSFNRLASPSRIWICPITLEPPVQNMTSTSTQANPPPAFSISSSGPESPPSVLTPELSSDFIYPKKGSNWRTVVINANSITHEKAKFQQWLITVILI